MINAFTGATGIIGPHILAELETILLKSIVLLMRSILNAKELGVTICKYQE